MSSSHGLEDVLVEVRVSCSGESETGHRAVDARLVGGQPPRDICTYLHLEWTYMYMYVCTCMVST